MKKLIFSFIALIVLFCFSPYIGAKFIQDETMIHSMDVKRENGDTPFDVYHENRTLFSQTIPSMDQCYYFYFKIYESYSYNMFTTGIFSKIYPDVDLIIYLIRGSISDIFTFKLPAGKEVLFTALEVPQKYNYLQQEYVNDFEILCPYNTIRVELSSNTYDQEPCALFYRWELY